MSLCGSEMSGTRLHAAQRRLAAGQGETTLDTRFPPTATSSFFQKKRSLVNA